MNPSTLRVDTTTARSARIRVLVPTILSSYTNGAHHVDLDVPAGDTEAPVLADLLSELNAKFPGFRFRIVDEQGKIRQHIKLFVDGELVRDLAVALPETCEVMIVGALSGG